jgi:Pin2-interacting protein X1
MLGIGAARRNDPDGIAWKQNKDFENLLKRLNEASAVDEDDTLTKVEDGEPVGKEGGSSEAEKKRKHEEELDDVTEERTAKKIRRKDREDRKTKKSKQATAKVTNTVVTPSEATTTPAYIPRHRA